MIILFLMIILFPYWTDWELWVDFDEQEVSVTSPGLFCFIEISFK